MSACVKNRGTSLSLQILHPTAFCFKEEGVLAAHPPSCHPRRVFGCPESAKKMRENEEKVRKAGELKASLVNFIDSLKSCTD